jgi:hypothetical protein
MASRTQPNHANLYRHGDVLVDQIDEIPVDVVERPHLVLAEGEMTGHSHRIAESCAAELFQAGGAMYLRVTAPTATLIHQEHGPVVLPQGDYRVWCQREYSPKEIRIVRD